MKNHFLEYFNSKMRVCVRGKNIERFLKRLTDRKIELYEIAYIKYDEVCILIKKSDYETLENIKTIYELSVERVYGLERLKQILIKNLYMLIAFLIGAVLLFGLTHITFEIEVIHNSKELRELLKEELKQNGIDYLKPIQSYDKIQKIKNNILEKYKDKIEWLEIETIGTKYIVRVEERILTGEKKEYELQDIVAKKSAILLKIEAESGEIVKNINDYVKVGDTVISGNIKLNEAIKNQIAAKGTIYGEVWYQATVEYPLAYHEEIETGKKKNVYTFRFLNKRIELLNFHPFLHKKIESETLWKSNIFPFLLTKEKQKEVNIIDETYTKKQAIEKATELATKKIQERLKEKEQIIRVQQLKVDTNESTIIVELFFAVMEDITDIKKLEQLEEEE